MPRLHTDMPLGKVLSSGSRVRLPTRVTRLMLATSLSFSLNERVFGMVGGRVDVTAVPPPPRPSVRVSLLRARRRHGARLRLLHGLVPQDLVRDPEDALELGQGRRRAGQAHHPVERLALLVDLVG